MDIGSNISLILILIWAMSLHQRKHILRVHQNQVVKNTY